MYAKVAKPAQTTLLLFLHGPEDSHIGILCAYLISKQTERSESKTLNAKLVGVEIIFKYRVKLDNNMRLLGFTEALERACVGVVESGKMTKDLAILIHGSK